MAMIKEVTARIMRQTGGFYYLYLQGEGSHNELSCRARGLFRKQGITPCVGDFAKAEICEDGTGYLVELLPRKNSLIRPAVANIDRLLLILSAVDPPPNTGVIDRLLAVCLYKSIDAAVIVTKSNVNPVATQWLTSLYSKAGYEAVAVDSIEGSVEAVRPLIEGRLCVFAGNSGVGKSTLLNALSPGLDLKTGETSQKLGRGRHTTRTTELYPLCGGLMADTPGFSSLETIKLERIRKEELEYCFLEFLPHLGNCRYTGCSHTSERNCAVLEALNRGEISPSRHKSYLEMYEEAKALKDWEQ